MRNELLKELRLEDLSGSSLELAEAIGMEGFIRLVDNYEGTSNLYVPKASELIRPVRDELIRREYNGKTSSHWPASTVSRTAPSVRASRIRLPSSGRKNEKSAWPRRPAKSHFGDKAEIFSRKHFI